MDNEMIERCAKAYSGCDLNSWHPNVQKQIKETIVDIIKAMREPTEKMQHIMQASLDCTPINRCEQQSKQVWQNTIDCIIND